jgi:hypothetical protein
MRALSFWRREKCAQRLLGAGHYAPARSNGNLTSERSIGVLVLARGACVGSDDALISSCVFRLLMILLFFLRKLYRVKRPSRSPSSFGLHDVGDLDSSRSGGRRRLAGEEEDGGLPM